MSRQNRAVAVAFVSAGVFLGCLQIVAAQVAGRAAGAPGSAKKRVVTATSPKKEEPGTPGGRPGLPDHVVINREALRLIDPKVYQVPLQLEAVRTVHLVALTDGIVRTVQIEPGHKVDAQTEAVRLDGREQQFLLDRAKVDYRVAQLEQKHAKSQKDAGLVELADAKLQAAKVDLDLATFRFERNSVRVPFAGKVFRVNVIPGQFVRAGEPLLKFADTSKLKVEIPVDRTQASEGKIVEIRIEEETTQATIKEILPLAPRFEPLRDLINSAASAVIEIDDPKDQFKVGQAVFVRLIPRQMIAEVPTASLENTADAGRKLQVVRKNVVRDVVVQLHGQVGTDRIFVSGPFAEGDEVIVNCSHELPDGTLIRPSDAAATKPRGEEVEKAPSPPKRRGANF